MSETQELIKQVSSGEITIGELLTIEAMYPARDHDIDSIRDALRILQERESTTP